VALGLFISSQHQVIFEDHALGGGNLEKRIKGSVSFLCGENIQNPFFQLF
jgi:hypothetical protein